MNTILKTGITTSEIWVVIAYGFINYFASCLGIQIPQDVEQWIATTIVAYILSRTVLKYKALQISTTTANVPIQPQPDAIK